MASMKKFTLLLIICLSTTLAFTACDDDESTNTGDNDAADGTTSDTTDTSGSTSDTRDTSDPCAGKTLCTTAGALSCGTGPERVLECKLDADKCLVLQTSTSCTGSETCEDNGGAPACVDPCADVDASIACTTQGTRRCTGDNLEVCEANTNNCLVFRLQADCSTQTGSNVCGEANSTPACIFDICADEADCTPGSTCAADSLTTCFVNASGCLEESTTDCATFEGGACDATNNICTTTGDPCQGVDPADVCDAAGTMCDPANPMTLWTCAPNALGCLVTTATACDSVAGIPTGASGFCDGSGAAAMCAVDTGDRCEGKEPCAARATPDVVCSDDSTTLVTCAYDNVGCLVQTSEVCADTDPDFVCVVAADADDFCSEPPPACTDDCVAGTTACAADSVWTCQADGDADPCFELVATQDCTLTAQACDDTGAMAMCVDVGPSTESEPNGSCAEANMIAINSSALGDIDPIADNDFFMFTITELSEVSIETIGADGTTCPGDTIIELYDDAACATTVETDDDGGVGLCSLITTALPPGTYYVSVADLGDNGLIPGYSISVTTAPIVCGNGTLEASEACDDGDTDAGDGCAADCSAIETGYVCPTPGADCVMTPPGDTCADATTLGEGVEVIDTSLGFTNAYTGYNTVACGNFARTRTGADQVFSVTVPAGAELIATLDTDGLYDGTLVIASDCANILTSCEAIGGFAINPQVARFDNTASATDTTVFVIADGETAADQGEALLEIVFYTPVCGNGTVDTGEACDDGDIDAGDGCAADCSVVEPGYVCPTAGTDCVAVTADPEVEPNNTCAEANSVAVPSTTLASINPGSESDNFTFTITERSIVTIETAGALGLGSACPGDTRIDLYDVPACTTPVESDDDDGSGVCSLITRDLQPGTYFVRARSFGSIITDYTLNIDAVAVAPEVCDDTIDNDGDTFTDCADPDCAADAACASDISVNDAPAADFGDTPATVTSTVSVGSTCTISSVTVDVDITHTYRGDVSISLTGPTGTAVDLKVGGTFDSVDNIIGNYPLALTPAESLDVFNGTEAQGDWTLTVTDEDTSSDDGVFNNWTLNVNCQ
jgi:cysteine-rich repeat protein